MNNKIFKSLILLLVVIMIFAVNPVMAYSNENIKINNFNSNNNNFSIEPFWETRLRANVYLESFRDQLNCDGSVRGISGTSKISAMMTLEERDGWSWRKVDHWSKISYSDYLSMSGTYRAVSGRTYKLTINADVTVNGVVERVSNSTEIRF